MFPTSFSFASLCLNIFCFNLFNLALDDGYMVDEEYNDFRIQLSETWKILNGYICYLEKCIKDGVPVVDKLNNTTT